MSLLIRRRINDCLISAIAVVLAAVLAQLIFRIYPAFKQHGFLSLFLIAVAFAAWRGGFAMAFTTIIFSSLMAAWLLPPTGSFRVNTAGDLVRVIIFIGVALAIAAFSLARHRDEEWRQERQRRLRFALESSGVACWDVDVQAGTFWKSANLPAIFGRTEAEFPTTYEGFFAYIHPEDRDFFRLANVRKGAGNMDYEIRHRIICGDGSTRQLSTRGRLYLDEEGKVQRMVGAVYELSDTFTSAVQHPVQFNAPSPQAVA